MGAADGGSWDTNDLRADGERERLGFPAFRGLRESPPHRRGRARAHTPLRAPLHPASPSGSETPAPAHDREGTCQHRGWGGVGA